MASDDNSIVSELSHTPSRASTPMDTSDEEEVTNAGPNNKGHGSKAPRKTTVRPPRKHRSRQAQRKNDSYGTRAPIYKPRPGRPVPSIGADPLLCSHMLRRNALFWATAAYFNVTG
jgi:hypothetical protein